MSGALEPWGGGAGGASLNRQERKALEHALAGYHITEAQMQAVIDVIYDVGDHTMERATASFLIARGLVAQFPELAAVLSPILQATNNSAALVLLKLPGRLM